MGHVGRSPFAPRPAGDPRIRGRSSLDARDRRDPRSQGMGCQGGGREEDRGRCRGDAQEGPGGRQGSRQGCEGRMSDALTTAELTVRAWHKTARTRCDLAIEGNFKEVERVYLEAAMSLPFYGADPDPLPSEYKLKVVGG